MMAANLERVVEIDTSLWKISLLGIAGTAFAALSGYYLLAAFQNGEARYYYFALAGFFFFLIVFLLQTLLIKYFQTQILIIALEVAALVAFFGDVVWRMLSGTFLFLLIAGVALIIAGAYSGQQHSKSSLKIHFFKFASKTLQQTANGLVLIVVLLYLGFNGSRGVPLSQEMLNAILKLSEPFARQYLPSLSLNMTVKEFFQEVALSSLTAEERQRLESLSPVIRANFTEGAIRALKTKINNLIDLSNVNDKDKIPVALYRLIIEKFTAANRAIQTSIIVTGGTLLFLILRIFIWPLTLLVNATAFFIFQILLATRFARIALEMRTKEVILMP